MGKQTPQAPTPPDPVATAAAQGQQNRESAVAQANLNRINQVTPQGTLTYDQIGTNTDGTPQFRQTQTYSPGQQALYDQQNKVAVALSGLADQNIGRVADTQSKPFDFSTFPNVQTNVSGGPSVQFGNTGGNINTTFDNAGPVQRGLDYSGATKLPGTKDFGAEGRRLADASYGQATSRLDPQFAQQDSDIKAALANKGISENSDAYRREYDNFNRSKNDAYNQANFVAQKAGADEQSRLFGLSMDARQQGVNEVNSQGQFGNQAQQQQFGQNQSSTQFGNDAANLRFQQEQQGIGTNNTAQNQDFNQRLTNTNLNNATRQQQIEEEAYRRNIPLNDIAALLGTGGGVQQPNFSPVSQVGVAAPDYQGAVYANYNAANQQYNQQLQAQSAGLGSIFGLAGSIGSAVAMSDARLKHNVKAIGKLASGPLTYVFSYIGSTARHFGVMAQDMLKVNPDAVLTSPNGYMMVDYRKVW